MKSRCEIWLSALEELGALCSVDTTHDAIRVVRRVEHEGDAFFTKTLPSYAKDLERSLASGSIPVELFEAFARRQFDVRVNYNGAGWKTKKFSSHGAPYLLGGFMDIVFNPTMEMSDWWYTQALDLWDLVPLMRVTSDEADVARMASAIMAIRQLCLMFSKEKDLCSDELIEASIEKYVTLDGELMHPLLMTDRSPSSEGDTLRPSGECSS